MKFSQAGKQALGEMEGVRLQAYLDSGGAPTIGIGHLLTKSERASGKIVIGRSEAQDMNPDERINVYRMLEGDYREGLTLEQVYALLDQDLIETEKTINGAVKVYLTQTQYDCLVCFCFNVGGQAFCGSTLVKMLNQGKSDEVPAQMRRWVHDNGVVVPGLVKRREVEIALWESGHVKLDNVA